MNSNSLYIEDYWIIYLLIFPKKEYLYIQKDPRQIAEVRNCLDLRKWFYVQEEYTLNCIHYNPLGYEVLGTSALPS